MSDVLDRIRTGAELDAMTFPPLAWAVPGLIPEGFGLLTGPPKAGKSWLTLDIALGVAAGGRVLGKIPTGTARPVLLLALEDGERRMQDRARTLLGPGEPIPANLHYLTEATPAEVLDAIDRWLELHGHAQPLVILDTLGKVLPPALQGEGSYQRDYRVGGRLKQIVGTYPGATLLVVHHTRKAGSDDWMDSTSGTNGLNGSADFTASLSRARGGEGGVIRVTGRDVPEGEYALTMSSGVWTLDGAALADAAAKVIEARAAEGLGDLSIEVLAIVSEHPDGVGPTEVARQLEMAPNKAGVYLARLAEAGRIRKEGRGQYMPLTTPVESVESVETEPLSPVFSTDSTLSTPLLGDDERPRCTDCTRRLGAAEASRGLCLQCTRVRIATEAVRT